MTLSRLILAAVLILPILGSLSGDPPSDVAAPAPAPAPVVIDETAPAHPVLVLLGGHAVRVDTVAVDGAAAPPAARPRPRPTRPRPVPKPVPPPRPAPDPLADAAHAYARGIPAAFRATADRVRSGELADINATVDALGKARTAAGADLGRVLDDMLRGMADESGAFRDPRAAAAVLAAVAAAMEEATP